MDSKTDAINGLFEYLRKKGVNEESIDNVFRNWSRKRIVDLYDEVFERTPFATSVKAGKSKNPFDFSASPALSGGPFPCSGFDCRVKMAEELGRFAALYADHTQIFHPIEDLRKDLKRAQEIDGLTRYIILADFKLFFRYRPLLEAGLVEIRKQSYSFCQECMDEVNKGRAKIEDAVNKIVATNANKFKVLYEWESRTNQPNVEVVGPEEFIGGHDFVFRLKEETKPYKSRDDKYWISRVILKGVSGLYPPFMDNNYSYLSNYAPDIEVLKYTTEEELTGDENSLLDGLSHDLPFIHNVPFSRLLELRKKEGESFSVYRDALRLALKSVENDAKNRSSEVFNDIVMPEINKIDNTVRKSKKLLVRNLSEDLLISAGAIALGLYIGLVSPTFGACLSAVGGVNFASGVVKQASHILSEPSEIRDSNYYFLWKVRKDGGKKV